MIFKPLEMEKLRAPIGLQDQTSNEDTEVDENWVAAEKVLRAAARELNVPFEVIDAEGAFYDSKIDCIAQYVVGREWQLG
jgi:threonyl-tRNA synthetase